MGFSTGKWDGNILTVYTTHIKQGWARRNGLPESDQATMTEHFLRHGNIMTHMTILYDPVYLSQPLIRTDDFLLDEKELGGWLWPCEYGGRNFVAAQGRCAELSSRPESSSCMNTPISTICRMPR